MYLQDTKAGHVSIAQAQQIALDICWLEWDRIAAKNMLD